MAQDIIIGFDGSPQSEDALLLARQLASAVGGRVAARTGGSERPPSGLTGRADLHDAELVSISATSAAGALHALAIECEAVGLVVGSTHRGAVRRVAPGSVGGGS
jgi:nucleotide-binding universal stress UspA family protein